MPDDRADLTLRYLQTVTELPEHINADEYAVIRIDGVGEPNAPSLAAFRSRVRRL